MKVITPRELSLHISRLTSPNKLPVYSMDGKKRRIFLPTNAGRERTGKHDYNGTFFSYSNEFLGDGKIKRKKEICVARVSSSLRPQKSKGKKYIT